MRAHFLSAISRGVAITSLAGILLTSVACGGGIRQIPVATNMAAAIPVSEKRDYRIEELPFSGFAALGIVDRPDGKVTLYGYSTNARNSPFGILPQDGAFTEVSSPTDALILNGFSFPYASAVSRGTYDNYALTFFGLLPGSVSAKTVKVPYYTEAVASNGDYVQSVITDYKQTLFYHTAIGGESRQISVDGKLVDMDANDMNDRGQVLLTTFTFTVSATTDSSDSSTGSLSKEVGRLMSQHKFAEATRSMNKGVGAAEMRVCVWNSFDGSVTKVPFITGWLMTGLKITSRGEVLGMAYSLAGHQALPFLWVPGVQPVLLKPLAEGASAYAQAINSSGEVVGTGPTQVSSDGNYQAILWRGNSDPIMLSTLMPNSEKDIKNADAISDGGVIAVSNGLLTMRTSLMVPIAK